MADTILNFEQIGAAYQAQAAQSGTEGNGGGVAVSYNGTSFLFEEQDGDSYTVEASALSDKDLAELAKLVGGTVKVEEPEAADAAGAPAEAAEAADPAAADALKTGAPAAPAAANPAESATLEQNRARLQQLQGEWDTTSTTADGLKGTIDSLSEQIEKEIAAALKEQKEISEDQKKAANKIVSEQIAQFKADREAGRNVTIDDMSSSISAAIKAAGYDEQLEAVVNGLIVTNAKIKQMDNLLNEVAVLNSTMEGIDSEMTQLQSTIAAQEEAARPKSCDPIGFEENGVKYEFVIDKDGNGALSNFSEFLGSKDNFDEMKALDVEGAEGGGADGTVSYDELQKAGVMVLVTDADGNQSLKSIEEAFGTKDVSINTNLDTSNATGNFINGQQLLGNFALSIDGQIKNGYSTNDSADYLLNNYTFTDENPNNIFGQNGAEPAAAAAGAEPEAAPLTEHAAAIQANYEFLDLYRNDETGKFNQIKENFDNLIELSGLTEDLLGAITENAQATGEYEARVIIDEMEKQAKEAQEAESTEPAADEADSAEEAEEDPEKDPEEDEDK